jgi:hypothetical protein
MPPLAAVPNFDAELDALYGLPLEDFTRARNDLAARLKRAHQSELAAEVRSLKKPTVTAAAANRLAREQTELVSALLEAADELREVQQLALRGKAGAAQVGDATSAERDAVRALVTAARRMLGQRSTPALLDRLGQTLHAAAIDDQARVLLERGRLTEDLHAVGFGGLEPVAGGKRRSANDLARAARERVAALRAQAQRLAEEADDAEHAAREAARTADLLRAEADEKRLDAEQSAQELADAEADLQSRR